jgi:glycosyltransferase involved in cell wall biosynthesis
MQNLRILRAHAPRARMNFETTDLQHLRQFRRAKLERHAGWLAMALKTKQWEMAVTRLADLTLVVSAHEQALLRRECPRANIQIHPPVHPVSENSPPFEARSGILFVGSFPHHPNEDAMRYYLEEIHPRVQARLDAPLYVVGPEPPEWLTARATDQIRVTGHVHTVVPYLQHARISLAPLRYGAGIKGKVLESMSFGVPVVGTTTAFEGIPAQHDSEGLIANGAEEFADALVQLYCDQARWERLSRNSRMLVEREYGRAAARARLASFVKGLERA